MCVPGYRIAGFDDNDRVERNIRCRGDGRGVDGWNRARPDCERM